MKLYQIALLSAATVAATQHHNHVHRHPARHGSPVERDAAVYTEVAPQAVVTIYELNGQDISYDDVEEGLKSGKYVLVGDTISTVIPVSTSSSASSSSTSSPTPTPTPSSTEAAAFYQKASSSTSEEVVKSTPESIPPPSPSSPSSAAGSSTGINSEFQDNTIPCSEFPSQYGAVPLNYLGLGGWSGVQNVPDFSGDLSSSTSISYISTAVSGSSCTANSFCSYACPAGYQKSQWPLSQGNTGQSIGGLYCNSDSKLMLSRTKVTQLCTEGAGGVQIVNKLSKNVAVCRTDYPGTEGETIPLNVLPNGQPFELTNVVSADYYSWEGAATTAQYYINPSGYSIAEACCWGDQPNLGNAAPTNVGVGVGAGGLTYMSLFPNKPTNPNGDLGFNIKITGSNLIGDCSYEAEGTGGTYYSNGVAMPNGCTVTVPVGGSATLEFS